MLVASAWNRSVSQPTEQHTAPPSNTAYRRGEGESENVEMTTNDIKKKSGF